MMKKINHIPILILLSSIDISASQKWTYKNKLGYTEYCCFCDYNFLVQYTIPECVSKNKNDTRLPFCNCNKGKLPKCPNSTTICNRQITCPENLAYQICKVPFLNDTKLVCNDSLQWEADFTCPECPENATVCNRQVTCPKRQYYQECKLPFGNNDKLVCDDNLKWKPNFTCPECPEKATVCDRQVTCPKRQYYQECKLPFGNNDKLVCDDNLKWKQNFTCPDPENSQILSIILAVFFAFLTIICIAALVCYIWKRRKSDTPDPVTTEDTLESNDIPLDTIVTGENHENEGPGMALPNGNSGGNARNNNGNDTADQDEEIEGPNVPLLGGNPGGNARNNNGNDTAEPNVNPERGSDSAINSSNEVDEEDNQPLISRTSGIEETGTDSGNEAETIPVRPSGVYPTHLYDPGNPPLSVISLSPDSLENLTQIEDHH